MINNSGRIKVCMINRSHLVRLYFIFWQKTETLTNYSQIFFSHVLFFSIFMPEAEHYTVLGSEHGGSTPLMFNLISTYLTKGCSFSTGHPHPDQILPCGFQQSARELPLEVGCTLHISLS